jgi:predicted RNase H-like nuclease (RuvC/YqgF family)
MVVAFSYYGEEFEFMSEGDTNPQDMKVENHIKAQIDNRERKVTQLQKALLVKDKQIATLRKQLLKLGASKTEVYGDYGDDDGKRTLRRLFSVDAVDWFSYRRKTNQ